jgi:ribonuclease HI
MRRSSGYYSGLRRNALLKIYTAYVRPILEFGSPIYASYAQSYLKPLILIEHMALRLILGTPSTTSIKAMYCESGLQPLEERMKELAALTHLRMSMDNISTLLQPGLDFTLQRRTQIFRSSLKGSQINRSIKYIQELLDTSGGLVTNNDLGATMDQRIQVDLSLALVETMSIQERWQEASESNAALTQLYVSSYVSPANIASVGLIYNGGDADSDEILVKLPPYTTKKYSDLAAIVVALRISAQSEQAQVIIHTDAYQLLRQLVNNTDDFAAYTINAAMSNISTNICLRWAPSHSNIEVMQRVKEIARRNTPDAETSIVMASSFEYLKSRLKLKNQVTQEMTRLSFLQGNLDYKHLMTPWTIGKTKSRSTETTITRLRLNRSRLKADLFRWKLIQSPICTECMQSPETVFHYFITCPAREIHRQELHQFFAREDILNPIECILTLGAGLEQEEADTLLIIIEEYLTITGLAYRK